MRGAGAIGHWRLGEASGATIADSSGRGNAGTLSGSYVRAQTGLIIGDADKATKLVNGATDGRATISTLAGQSSTEVSVEAWVTYLGTQGLDVHTDVASRGWGSAGGWRLSVYKGGDGQHRGMFAVNVGGTVYTSTGADRAGPRAPRRALHRHLRRHVRQRRVHVRHGDRGRRRSTRRAR